MEHDESPFAAPESSSNQGEADSNPFASSVSATGTNDGASDSPFSPTVAKASIPKTVLGEDARRVGAYASKLLDGMQNVEPPKQQTPEEFMASEEERVRKWGTPLNAGFHLAGEALNILQQHIGKHVAAGMLKFGMSHDADELASPFANVPDAAKLKSDPTRQFNERWQADVDKGGSALHDARPTAASPASPKEYYLRELLSTIGGDQFKLNEEEALPALNQMTESTIDLPEVDVPIVGKVGGKIPVSAVLASITHEIGGLPLFVFGTGAGARAVAGERQALATSEKLLLPKQLVKETARIQTKEAAIEGAVQGGVGAAKSGQDPGAGMLMGGFAGGVIGKLSSMFHGAKSEVLAGVNKARAETEVPSVDGIGLPPLSWKEYVKQGETVSSRSQPKIRKAVDTSSQYPTESAQPRDVFVMSPMGDEKAPFTFKTVKRSPEGVLNEIRYADNAKTNSRKVVYRAPVGDKEVASYRKNGMPVNTDDDAWVAVIDKMFPQYPTKIHTPDDPTLLRGTYGYHSPETIDRFFAENGVDPKALDFVRLVDESPAPTKSPTPATPVRGNEKTVAIRGRKERPVILHADNKTGHITATPVEDGALDDTLITPRKVEAGDVVQLPNGDKVIVDEVRNGTVNLRAKDGQTSTASVHDVTPVSDVHLKGGDFAFRQRNSAKFVQPVKGEKLLALGKITVPRAMKVMGMSSPPEATALLQDMVKAGQIVDAGGGVFRPHKSYTPEYPEAAQQGYLVYYDTGGNGAGKIGTVRGRDPKNPNNYIVEFGDSMIGPRTPEQVAAAQKAGVKDSDVFVTTEKISIPLDQVRTLKPVLKGNAKLSDLPAQIGVQTPMPPEIIVAAPAVAHEVAQYTAKVGQLTKLLSTPKAAGKAVMDFFYNEAWRVPLDLQAQATKLASSQGAVKANAVAYQEDLAAKLGGQMSSLDQALSKIAQKNASNGKGVVPSSREAALRQFFGAHPEMQGEVEQTVRAAIDRLKSNSERLALMGFGNIKIMESLRNAGVEEEYIANVYLKYMTTRKEYAKFAKDQMPARWQEAIKYLSEKTPGVDAQGIEDQMLQILNMDVEAAHEAYKTSPNGDVKKQLKARIDMSDAITGILGRVDSFSVRMAHSIAATDALIMRVNVWNEIAKTPYWSPGPRIDLGSGSGARVPDLAIFGNARGGRLHESLKFLTEAKMPHQEGQQMLRAISSYWKYNVVVAGGFAPWVNNVMRNWKGMVLSGGIQSLTDFTTFFDAAKIMLEFKENPILNGPTNLLAEAVENGAVGTGLAGKEIFKRKMANKVLAAVRSQNGQSKDMWDLFAAIPHVIKGGAEEVGAAYDTIDRLFKFTAYLNNRRNAIARGMSPDDAAGFATIMNSMSFPNYEMVAPTIEKMRNGSVSGIAPFLSSKAEDMRINAMLVSRLAKGDTALMGHLIKASMVFGAAFGLAREIRRANGITDKMAAKANDQDKLSSQQFRPFRFVLPELDDKGRMQLADVTPWEDAMMTCRMHETDNPLAAILRNTVTDYMGEDTLAGGVTNQIMSAATGIRPLSTMNPPEWKPGENGVLTFLAYIAQHGGVPQLPTRWNDIENKAGMTNPWQAATHEQWTPAQVNYKKAGLPFAGPVGIKTDAGRGLEAVKNIKTVEKQIVPSQLNNMSDKQHQKFLLQQKVNAIKGIADEYRNRGK